MPSERKFYKNTFTVVVLSEGTPVEEATLTYLGYLVSEGDCVLHSFVENPEEVDGLAMANLLTEAASTPDFFMLTPNGEDEEDELYGFDPNY
jgi:hypothetical protein